MISADHGNEVDALVLKIGITRECSGFDFSQHVHAGLGQFPFRSPANRKLAVAEILESFVEVPCFNGLIHGDRLLTGFEFGRRVSGNALFLCKGDSTWDLAETGKRGGDAYPVHEVTIHANLVNV